MARVPVARVPAVFPQAASPVHQTPSRPHPAGNVRRHPAKTTGVAGRRLPAPRPLGMRLGPRGQDRRCAPDLLCHPRLGGALAAEGRLFRGPHQRRHTAPRGRRGRRGKDQVPGRDVALPMGQQDADLPRRTSRDPYRPRPHRHLVILWIGQGGHPPSLRALPSRAAPSPRGQTHHSPLRQVRRDRDAQTSPRATSSLPRHAHPTHPTRDLVHPRTRQGRGKGLHHHHHPRSLAFSRIAMPHGTLCRVRQHLAQDQAGILWLPELGPHSRATTAVRPRLPPTRGHRARPPVPRQESREESHSQTHAQLFLGQIRRKPLQAHHPGRHHPRASLPSRVQSHLPHSHGADLQPHRLGSGLLGSPAFTTCHARLKLYEYLDHLKEQVLYFDTVSVIYSHRPGQPDIPTADYLGEMTDELEGDDHIVDFSSGGPKNYGYKTRHGKVECKVRGFTLNMRGSWQLNYDVLRQNVLDELTDPLDHRRDVPVVNPHFFTRHPATKQLKVGPRIKQYGLVFDKRVVDPNTFRSFPYGYISGLDQDVDMRPEDALLALWEG